MSITIFGVVWIMALLYCVTKNVKIIFFLLLFSALFQSNNVIEIGSVGVGAFLTTSFAFILMSGLMKPKRHPDKKKAIGFILSYILFFVICCAVRFLFGDCWKKHS